MTGSVPTATVLYVEDDSNDIYFVGWGFETAGLTNPIHVVTDGEQAIDYLAGNGPYADRAQYPVPALVLLDLNLPMLSGIEVLRWIRQQSQYQSLPVVIFSASDQDADKEKARQLGASDYLVKPADMTTLPEIVQALARRWLGQ